MIDAPPRDVDALVAALSLEEKLAQLVGLWLSAGDGDVAPMQHEMLADVAPFDDFVRHGLGQLTRPLATHPLDPLAAAERLGELQRAIVEATPHRIPALAGTGGTITLDGPFYQPGSVVLASPAGERHTVFDEPAVAHDALHFQAAEAARRIAAGQLESPIRPLRDSIATLGALDEIRRRLPDRRFG